jgi:hypothetical protein
LIWFLDCNINVEEGVFSSLFSFEGYLEFVATSLETKEVKLVFFGGLTSNIEGLGSSNE